MVRMLVVPISSWVWSPLRLQLLRAQNICTVATLNQVLRNNNLSCQDEDHAWENKRFRNM